MLNLQLEEVLEGISFEFVLNLHFLIGKGTWRLFIC